MFMNVTVVGAGYVGLVTAACLAELGHRVGCVDRDAARVTLLQAGGVPIYEPGLEALVVRNQQAGRLRFTTRLAQVVPDAELVFIAVGTPPLEDGSADVSHVLEVARNLCPHLKPHSVVINKSTVPVGTAENVWQTMVCALADGGRAGTPFTVVSNPEFLKEGAAIDDFMRPDRIVIGTPPGAAGEHARRLLAQLYAPFNRHHDRTVWMDVPSAELTKYAANAMLATRISFMNEMAHLADAVGADIDSVRRGIGADPRIGHGFLYAGTGYGGSCFPKDTQALVRTARQHGLPMQVVEAVEQVNRAQKLTLVRQVTQLFGQDLRGLRFAVWGLAFKPNTNDMREAPSRPVVAALLERGAVVVAHDPVAMPDAQTAFALDLANQPEPLTRLQWATDPMAALNGADALLVITEWKCYQNPDFDAMRSTMRHPVVLDGRNLYDPQQMADDWIYAGIGRRNRMARLRLNRAQEEDTAWSEAFTPAVPLPATPLVRR
jgi:UDPglucose 6-dehydrogenase